ncbi:hypothetical protein LTS08_005198 [Lithohypha guttulata]|nr:hypothetical protein LTS08_005198 [Lithohypha guttulata]
MTTTSMTSRVPGNGTDVLIPPNDPVAPSTPIPTSRSTTTTTTTLTSSPTIAMISSTSSSTSQTTSLSSSSTLATSLTSTMSITSTSSEASSSAEEGSTSTTTTSSTTSEEGTTTSVSSSTTTSASSEPAVTNQAYIDTILRHHNAHRANHSADALTWDAALAATSKKTADSCVYAHDTVTDCPSALEDPPTSCYGQNIGAGYLSTQMGYLISDGFYNSEVEFYTYYGGEPDVTTLRQWGHFSQIVWSDTQTVGCYTTGCSDTELVNIAPSSNIRPVFTVCNYGPAGNFLDEFANNVIQPLDRPSIYAGYQCPTAENCEDNAWVDIGIEV